MGVQKFFLYGLVALAVLSCRNPDDVGRDLESSLTGEGHRWLAVLSSTEQAGDKVSQTILKWAQALQRLRDYTRELAALVADTDPADLKGYQARIDLLRDPLDRLLSRSDQVTLRIPVWSESEIEAATSQTTAMISDILVAYATIYGRAANRPTFALKVEIDERLYDTYGDCVSLFARSNDPNCKVGAASACTHQMNLACVKRLISDQTGWSGLNCTKTVQTRDESYEVVAEWLAIGLRACQSTEPVFR